MSHTILYHLQDYILQEIIQDRRRKIKLQNWKRDFMLSHRKWIKLKWERNTEEKPQAWNTAVGWQKSIFPLKKFHDVGKLPKFYEEQEMKKFFTRRYWESQIFSKRCKNECRKLLEYFKNLYRYPRDTFCNCKNSKFYRKLCTSVLCNATKKDFQN